MRDERSYEISKRRRRYDAKLQSKRRYSKVKKSDRRKAWAQEQADRC